MVCKFCKNSTISNVLRTHSNYVQKTYTLHECGRCGCRFYDLGDHPVSLTTIYDDYYKGKGQSVSRLSGRRSTYWDRQIQRIERILGRPIDSVLDIGCGTGDFLSHLPDGILREGVELSTHVARIAEEKGIVVHKVMAEDIGTLSRYTVITCYAILEHLLDPVRFLKRVASLVYARGLLVVMIPTYESLKRWIFDKFAAKEWHMYSPPLHLNFFSRKFLDHCMAQNGFTLVERYWTSGGMVSPFRRFHFGNRVVRRLIALVDEYTILNRLPIFDHLYSYYLKSVKDSKTFT